MNRINRINHHRRMMRGIDGCCCCCSALPAGDAGDAGGGGSVVGDDSTHSTRRLTHSTDSTRRLTTRLTRLTQIRSDEVRVQPVDVRTSRPTHRPSEEGRDLIGPGFGDPLLRRLDSHSTDSTWYIFFFSVPGKAIRNSLLTS